MTSRLPFCQCEEVTGARIDTPVEQLICVDHIALPSWHVWILHLKVVCFAVRPCSGQGQFTLPTYLFTCKS